MRQLIVDTETTGFEAKEGHRIIEFAALEMIDRRLTGNYLHLYFNPERDIPLEATQIHGITLDQVINAPRFADKVNDILVFIQDAELIIHNAKFDLSFLDHHFKELGHHKTKQYAHSVIDTLAIARTKFPGAKNNLNALCDRFKVDRSSREYHGALIDCELLAHVYLHLTREQISLLAESATNSAITGNVQAKLDTSGYNLVHAKVSPAEQELHLAYLKKLDKSSKGNCMWLKQIKDYLDD